MTFLRPSAWMTEMQGIGNRAVCRIHELGEIRGCGSYTTWDVKKAGIHEHELIRAHIVQERSARRSRTGDLNQRLGCLMLPVRTTN